MPKMPSGLCQRAGGSLRAGFPQQQQLQLWSFVPARTGLGIEVRMATLPWELLICSRAAENEPSWFVITSLIPNRAL